MKGASTVNFKSAGLQKTKKKHFVCQSVGKVKGMCSYKNCFQLFKITEFF